MPQSRTVARETPAHPKVLVVDDEPSLRALVKIYLERNRFGVVEAGSGEEALQIFYHDPTSIHLLLTDLVMPGMSGRELATNIRKFTPKLPIILMSGYSEDSGDHLTGVRCLGKPLDFKLLVLAAIDSLRILPPQQSTKRLPARAIGNASPLDTDRCI